MSRTYPAIDGGQSSCFITPKGGTISLTGDPPRVAGLERITTTPTGVAFGPLLISTPDLADDGNTVAAIENLRFAPTKDHNPDEADDGWLPSWGDDDDSTNETTTSGLLGLSMAGGAAATDDETLMTRRQTIGVMASALALGATETASAQDEPTKIKFAAFDLVRSDGPVHVGVLPIVDNALPADMQLTLSVDGSQRREWTPADVLDDPAKPTGETIMLEGSTRERVTVYAEGGVGDVDRIMAWAKGVLASEKEITATLELPTDPTTLEAGASVVIDDHPAFVEAVREDQGSESVVTIGGESIPHESEQFGHDRGYYRVRENALEYVAGPEPPPGTVVYLRLRAGRIASITDSTDRLLEL